MPCVGWASRSSCSSPIPAVGRAMPCCRRSGRWQREHATKLVVALISRGTVEANRPKVTEYGLTHVLLQKDREVAQAYQAYWNTQRGAHPSAMAPLAVRLAQGADAIRALVATALTPAGVGYAADGCCEPMAMDSGRCPTTACRSQGGRAGPGLQPARSRWPDGQPRGLPGRHDAGALLAAQLRLLPAHAPRPQSLGSPPARGCTQSCWWSRPTVWSPIRRWDCARRCCSTRTA